jgi:hypothetical protein
MIQASPRPSRTTLALAAAFTTAMGATSAHAVAFDLGEPDWPPTRTVARLV